MIRVSASRQSIHRHLVSMDHTFWRREVDNVAIFLEHVHFLNGLDRLHVHLLQCRLQLLVVGARALMDLFHLPARSSLSAEVVSQSIECTGNRGQDEARTKPRR